ncbi:MAG: ferrous iron transport protein B [Alistipes sp.]|nr:ferrous iron transport protein B [Alistipes sp.]
MLLSDLRTGESAVIVKVLGHGGFRRRILEMGFVRGQRVEAILNAPLRDPIKYRLMGYEVSLRRSEAAMVEVITLEEARVQHMQQVEGVATSPNDDDIEQVINQKIREINIALVGNPNSGKTSLFNALSGGHEHVGNYSGVTVGAKSGTCHYKGYKINITDLPGTYALSAYTPEEMYVRHHLMQEMPDVVINAVVASNIERNLFLTTELIDLNPKMVVALNMYDELESSGAKLNYEQLGKMIGVPMVPVIARNGKGLNDLLDEVILTFENENPKVRHIHIQYSSSIETEVCSLASLMKQHAEELPKCFPPRYWSVKMLEKDSSVEELLSKAEHYQEWSQKRDRAVARIKTALGEDVESAVTNEKYGFIEGALAETYTPSNKDNNRNTSIIDRIVTHKYLGIPLFLLVMFVMFWSTFTLGAYPQEWIEAGFSWLGEMVGNMMSDGPLRDLIVDGIIGGVGSVAVFLPNILILYLFISLMEDSGYMARAAFIMDKLMHLAGLHGKSFIPLVMGFGCNVPAIMATRTIESHSSRLITILINPFMSCSARLPVFILLAGTFFPEHAGLALFGIYLFGGVMAILTARVLRRFMFGADETPFVMELPPYRIPTINATLRHMWERSEQYLKKIGGLILVAAIVIWFLSYYPRTSYAVTDADVVENISVAQSENSYLGRIGKFCEPVMEPLGLDWRASVAMLSGAAAKEIVVSTLGVLYSVEDAESDGASLSQHLLASGNYSRAAALAMMIFVLLYFPCIATVSAIAQETGGWKWALFSVVYNTVLAWVVAFAAFHIGGLLGM